MIKKALNLFFVSVILNDFVFRTGKNYSPQVFLEEWKYVVCCYRKKDS